MAKRTIPELASLNRLLAKRWGVRLSFTTGERPSIREQRPLGPCRFREPRKTVDEAGHRSSLEPIFFRHPKIDDSPVYGKRSKISAEDLPEIRRSRQGDHSDSLEVYLYFRAIFDLREGV
jgi:hypothetical protein